jgi:oxaloacetate decarboxylase (Na+ extruding) subunit alpha
VEKINFIDTTLRDGQQSLWGMRMRAGMILPIAPIIDRTGYKVVDYTGSSLFDVLVRYCREDPWEGLRRVAAAITRTPLRAGVCTNRIVGFGLTPDSIIELWVKRLCANGIRSFWIFDGLYGTKRISKLVSIAKGEGAEAVGTLFYASDPVHTDNFYAKKANEISRLDVDGIYVEDMGGLLTPERTKTLIPSILHNCNGVPTELHAHCNTGLAPLCYLEAIKQGIRTLHTAVLPLANGTSLPSTENILENIIYMGYASDLDANLVKAAADHFKYIAKREGMPIGIPAEYKVSYYEHQVPGGMVGTLRNNLVQLGMEDRLEEVLYEVSRIRKELGYVLMVTPYSQFVGSQAVLNVASGERYKTVSDEIIMYVLGYYGEPVAPIDEDVMDKITSFPRAKEFVNWKPPQPTIGEVRKKFGSSISDDDLLLRFLLPEEDIKSLLASGPLKTDYPNGTKPLIALFEELRMREKVTYVYIKKDELSITLQQ